MGTIEQMYDGIYDPIKEISIFTETWPSFLAMLKCVPIAGKTGCSFLINYGHGRSRKIYTYLLMRTILQYKSVSLEKLSLPLARALKISEKRRNKDSKKVPDVTRRLQRIKPRLTGLGDLLSPSPLK